MRTFRQSVSMVLLVLKKSDKKTFENSPWSHLIDAALTIYRWPFPSCAIGKAFWASGKVWKTSSSCLLDCQHLNCLASRSLGGGTRPSGRHLSRLKIMKIQPNAKIWDIIYGTFQSHTLEIIINVKNVECLVFRWNSKALWHFAGNPKFHWKVKIGY